MKNKIHKYDFLIIGAGLIGAIAALALVKKKFKVLVIDKNKRENAYIYFKDKYIFSLKISGI